VTKVGRMQMVMSFKICLHIHPWICIDTPYLPTYATPELNKPVLQIVH
jgi:hypothetical protein